MKYTSVEVKKRAKEKGFVKIICESCSGRGIEITDDANPLAGKQVYDPCGNCSGYGRYWSNGGSTHTVTDDELMNLP
jgi:DnaJ-class molecular chaperone